MGEGEMGTHVESFASRGGSSSAANVAALTDTSAIEALHASGARRLRTEALVRVLAVLSALREAGATDTEFARLAESVERDVVQFERGLNLGCLRWSIREEQSKPDAGPKSARTRFVHARVENSDEALFVLQGTARRLDRFFAASATLDELAADARRIGSRLRHFESFASEREAAVLVDLRDNDSEAENAELARVLETIENARSKANKKRNQLTDMRARTLATYNAILRNLDANDPDNERTTNGVPPDEPREAWQLVEQIRAALAGERSAVYAIAPRRPRAPVAHQTISRWHPTRGAISWALVVTGVVGSAAFYARSTASGGRTVSAPVTPPSPVAPKGTGESVEGLSDNAMSNSAAPDLTNSLREMSSIAVIEPAGDNRYRVGLTSEAHKTLVRRFGSSNAVKVVLMDANDSPEREAKRELAVSKGELCRRFGGIHVSTEVSFPHGEPGDLSGMTQEAFLFERAVDQARWQAVCGESQALMDPYRATR